MWSKIRQIITASFDGGVVAIVLGTAGIIAAMLAVPQGLLTPHQIKIFCLVIGAYGLLVAVIKINEKYKKIRARELLTKLVIKGRGIIAKQRGPMTEQLDREAKAWCSEVERVLSKYLDKSYILHFRVYINRGNIYPEHPEWFEAIEIHLRVQQVEQFVAVLNN